jgi:hypothetical protein
MVAWGAEGTTLPALMGSADVYALPPPFSPGAPQFAPHPSNGDRGDIGANTLSLGRHPEGLLRLSLGQGLHHSSPLVTGVTAGVGRSGPRLSDALRVASRTFTGGPACRGCVCRRVAESVNDRCLGCSVGCFGSRLGKTVERTQSEC